MSNQSRLESGLKLLTMKKVIMLSLTVILSFQVNIAFTQIFEGVMLLEHVTKLDTTLYNYYVKGYNIRIEELGEQNVIEGVMLINIKEKKIWAMSPARKLYYEVPCRVTDMSALKKQLEITKSKNKKTIAGYACEQWIVKNKEQDRAIAYWVVPEGFDFFKNYIVTITLTRKDNMPNYFLQIEDIDGVMPFLIEERTLLREDIAKLEVKKVEKKKLDPKLFTIPADYQEFKRSE